MYPVYMETQSDPFFTGLQHNKWIDIFSKGAFFFSYNSSHSQNIHCYKSMCEIKYENKVFTKRRILIQDFFITLIVYNKEKHVWNDTSSNYFSSFLVTAVSKGVSVYKPRVVFKLKS